MSLPIRDSIVGLALVAVVLAGGAGPARADSDERVARLEAELKKLQQQVTELRALMPTITTFMPDFSERFHVMHRAGEAGDWAVAQHELLELRRMVGTAKVIDAEKGRLMESFMSEPLTGIAAAIEHQDEGRFLQALEGTLKNCNACHVAAGSPFINVALDADRTVSMRHAHQFLKTEPMSEHTHSH